MNPEQKKLVEENHSLIFGFLSKENLSKEEYYDLAAIGLCEAAQIYDPDRGISFSTLGYRCMYNSIGHEIRKSSMKKRKAVVLSYDQTTAEDGSISYLDMLESTKNTETEVVSRMMLASLLAGMTPKNRDILLLLSQGYTQQEVAKLVNTSQSWVSSVRLQARKQLAN